MKNVKWYHWVLITVVILFIIIAVTPAGEETCPQCPECKPIIKAVPITKEVIKEVEIIKEIPINQKEINNLKQKIKIQSQILKLDNQAFLLFAGVIDVSSKATISAYYHRDNELTLYGGQITKINNQLNNINIQKTQLLLKLKVLK